MVGINTFTIGIIGRSMSGKSTFIAHFIEDSNLKEILTNPNIKGKTKVDCEFHIQEDNKKVAVKIEVSDIDSVITYYKEADTALFKKDCTSIQDNLGIDIRGAIREIERVKKSDEKITENEELISKIINLIEEKLNEKEPKEILVITEQCKELRNFIRKIIIEVAPSILGRSMLKDKKCKKLVLIDTKGYGDNNPLAIYSLPKMDALLCMVRDNYADEDYTTMINTVGNHLKQVPVVVCAISDKLSIKQIEQIIKHKKSYSYVSAFRKIENKFSNANEAGWRFKLTLKEYISRKGYQEAIMEKLLGEENRFRELPYLHHKNDTYEGKVISDKAILKNEQIYDSVARDIVDKLIDAKRKEEDLIQNLRQKINNSTTQQQITSTIELMISKEINAFLQSILDENKTDQDKYIKTRFMSIEFFKKYIHQKIVGERGGTAKYYNYSRLSNASYACIENAFEKLNEAKYLKLMGINELELEIFIRQIRRKYSSFRLDSTLRGEVFTDKDTVIKGYNQAKGKWNQNGIDYFYNKTYHLRSVAGHFSITDSEILHALSIYYLALKEITDIFISVMIKNTGVNLNSLVLIQSEDE